MVLHHPEKTACHDRKRRQEVEFEHIRRTYNIRKAVVVQCRVQRSRVLERNVVGILPLSGKSLQDCLSLQSVPKECVRYRWSVLFHMKFDLTPIPDDVLMPSSGEKFQFVYGDSRKSGRIIATSEPFKFGLEDDLTELGGGSKLKKEDSLLTPYLELQLNSNWSNNNAAGSGDEDNEDGKEVDVGLGDSSGSDKEDGDGNCLSLPTIDEETLAAIPYTENTTAPATEEGSNLVASAEDEYVFVAAEDMTRQCLSDDVSDQNSFETENVRDIKIDGKVCHCTFKENSNRIMHNFIFSE
ncbi:uncharacterized protein LOC117114390 [Anneissia japonica]|uniref:uncharacterized protein LOC117114390 n=1 Tax=Anneissia japonica TaxID=1529436 RepID=UPI0014257D43|nr:uncharacterized protein LOC117114390 [Anneissia japonica]